MESPFAKDVEAVQVIQGKTLVCRLCHKEGESAELINGHDTHIIETESSTNSVTLFDILHSITNLTIEREELSCEFCSQCCKELLSHYLFAINCLEQEKRLIDLINPLSQHKLDCINVKSEPDVESRSYYLFAFNPIEESAKGKAKKRKVKTLPDLGRRVKSKTEGESGSEFERDPEDESTSLLVFDPLHKPSKRKSIKKENNDDLPLKGGPCDFCGKVCKKRDILKHHRYVCKKRDRQVLPDPEVTFVCDICNNTYYTIGRLHYHKKIVHTAYTVPCEICGKLFKSFTQLQIHSRVHSDRKVQKFGFPCEFCGMMLGKEQTLKLHHFVCKSRDDSFVPDPNSKFVCDLCNSVFYSRGKIHYHMKTVHIASTLPCEICGKMFKTLKHLLTHLTVHSDIKMYTCRYCHNGFKTPNGLKYHERIHTGETPFPCSECDMSFLSASRRKAHFLSKHCEKSAMCNICCTKFVTNSRVRQHMKKVHFKGTNKAKITALAKGEKERIKVKPITKLISVKPVKKGNQK